MAASSAGGSETDVPRGSHASSAGCQSQGPVSGLKYQVSKLAPGSPGTKAPRPGLEIVPGLSPRDSDSVLSQRNVVASPKRGKPERAVPAKSLAAKVDAEATKHFTLRQKLYCLFDPSQPQPTVVFARAATGIAITVFVFILVSVAAFCVESLPEYYAENRQDQNANLRLIETICVSVFTIELLAKGIGTDPHPAFWTDPYNWIDIAAVLPYYVELITQGGGVNLVFLRVVRLARVFRMFKLGQYSKPLQMVIIVLQNSVDAVFLLVFLLFVCVILFSSLMWLAEQHGSEWNAEESLWFRDSGEVSRFQSIPDAMWWCMVTLTTVGYGDYAPKGKWGKVVGSACIIVGLFVLAFPVILIGYHYSELERDMMLRELGYPEGSQPFFCLECGRPFDAHANADRGSNAPPDWSQSRAEPGSPLRHRTPQRERARPVEALELPAPAASRWADPREEAVCASASSASAPASPLSPLPPLPPPGSVICHWRPDPNGKPAEVHYEGLLAGAAQFRYAPLFTPVLTASGELHATVLSAPEAGVHLLRLMVCIDHVQAAQRVAEAVRGSRLFDDPRNGPVLPECCFARPLAHVSCRIPQLPAASALSVSEWAAPGDVIGVHIRAADAEALHRLQQRLGQLTLHFSGHFKESPAAQPGDGLAVPGQVQDTARPESPQEPDIECTVPLQIYRARRTPPATGDSPPCGAAGAAPAPAVPPAG
eukprot:TRINITY_DN3594_c0_g1_i1.p1 TRINITY_DN3594_c0_g1~~TRINITY_DN3594_c0_g1_i1.p1  ORF type:complete len:740 (+),score=198.58 TRINITY_DN3594_c0_g1_i1:93-2222(+)